MKPPSSRRSAAALVCLIDKQIAYWRVGAEEDWAAGSDLVTRVGEVLECLNRLF